MIEYTVHSAIFTIQNTQMIFIMTFDLLTSFYFYYQLWPKDQLIQQNVFARFVIPLSNFNFWSTLCAFDMMGFYF